MKNKSLFVRVISRITIFVLVVFGLFIISSAFSNVYAFEISSNEDVEQKVLSTATIDEHFTDNIVLVSLAKELTFDFKKYTATDFPELDVSSVSEITETLTDRLESQIKNESSEREVSSHESHDIGDFRRILRIELASTSKENVLEAISLLEKRDDVWSASPNYIGEYYSVTPNDTHFALQWAIDSIQLREAWGLSTGDAIRVGIVDSGVDINHPDLADNINIDLSRDHSGTGNPWATVEGHGTHVAGIVGAVGNNGLGIAGTNWNVELISQKAGDLVPTAEAVTAALIHAEASDIPILNMSLTVNETTAMNDAINAYRGIIIAAAGNSGNTNVGYPARLNHPRILSVGSLTSSDDRSSFSCWGKVDIWAPGSSILSTWPIGFTQHDPGRPGYRTIGGTSMASPYVVGVASLILSINPNLSAEQVRAIIIGSGKSIDITHPSSGGGTTTISVLKLNAYSAIQSISPPPHTHTYTHRWLSLRQHNSSCLCGDTRIRPHIVSSDWDGVGYATCLDCGGPAELGIVILSYSSRIDADMLSMHIEKYFGNGSFALLNEIIVLSDEDLEKYYDRTLVLPNCCGSLDCDNHCDDCIDCDDHCHDCMDCPHHSHESEIDDSIYLYFDRRGFNYNYYLNRKDEDFFKRQ